MSEFKPGDYVDLSASRDDSDLIATWDLALEEYNKFFSIDPRIREQELPISTDVIEDEIDDEMMEECEEGEISETEEKEEPIESGFLESLTSTVCEDCLLPKPVFYDEISYFYHLGFNASRLKIPRGLDPFQEAWFTAGFHTNQRTLSR